MKSNIKRGIAAVLALVVTLVFAIGNHNLFRPVVASAADLTEHYYVISGYNSDNNIKSDTGETIYGHSFCLDAKLDPPSATRDQFKRYKLSEVTSITKAVTKKDGTYYYYDRVYTDAVKTRLLKLMVDYYTNGDFAKYVNSIDATAQITYLVENNMITGSHTVDDIVNEFKKYKKSFIQNAIWAVIHDDSEFDYFVKDDGTADGTEKADNYRHREKNVLYYTSADPLNDPYSLWNILYKPAIDFIDNNLTASFADGYDAWIYEGPDHVQTMLGSAFKTGAAIRVRKVDSDNDILPGAEFKLYDHFENVLAEWTSSSTDFVYTGLNYNELYRIEETKPANENYAKIDDVTFYINLKGQIVITSLGDGVGVSYDDDGDYISITNTDPYIYVRKVNENGITLPGCGFVLLDEDYKVATDSQGAALEWESTSSYYRKVKNLEKGKTYILHEVYAPEGYVLADDVVFKIGDSGKMINPDTNEEIGDTIVVKNEKSKVVISKVDIADSKEVEGAHLQVLDDALNVVDEWDSTTTAHTIEGLKTGVVYTIRETVAPEGYALTSDITFTINSTGKVTSSGTVEEDGTILVEDALTRVSISKVDMADSKEVEGARLQVLDEASKVVDEWDSALTAHVIEGLKTGVTYTIRETVAPDGYVVTTDITFVIDENGEVTTLAKMTTDGIILVEDARDLGNLQIKKTIDGLNVTDEEKAGALKFTITDSDGKYLNENGELSADKVEITLDKFTKNADGEYILTLENIASGEYTIIETNSAIEGYVLNSKSVVSAKGIVEYDKTTVVGIEDIYDIDDIDTTIADSQGGNSGVVDAVSAGTPSTGDRGYGLYTALMLIALMTVTACAVKKNKKRI